MTNSLRAHESGATEAPRRLLHVFPTFALGGSQSRFAQLLRLWKGRYRHSIVALDGVLAMADKLPRDSEVDYVGPTSLTQSTWAGIRQAADIIEKVCPDVLVTYNWGSFNWWLAKRLKPQLAHVHIEDGFGPEERETLLRRRNVARRFVLRDKATSIVLPSQKLYQIAQRDWSLPVSQLHYIPNGIDWRRFFVDRRSLESDGPLTLGTLATLRREKNITRLISLFNQAAALRPSLPMELKIVGDGDQLPDIKRIVSESPYRHRITLCGATDFPEKALGEMDIFALTSDTEQMPLSVLEAMAASLPIVSFDVGDVASMVSQENRHAASIDKADDKGFVDVMLELAESREKRLALGHANLNTVKKGFDAHQMANAYAALFD